MRMWHKDLIDVLPRKQLTAQWRELCYIVKRVGLYGTPNHVLVNPVIDFPISHLYFYASMVHDEMERRGYRSDFTKVTEFIKLDRCNVTQYSLFAEWHNQRYLNQCFYNLEEKHDRGAISDYEWELIYKKYFYLIYG